MPTQKSTVSGKDKTEGRLKKHGAVESISGILVGELPENYGREDLRKELLKKYKSED